MYSFGEQLPRPKWLALLGFQVVFLLAIHAQAQESSFSVSSGEGLLPCVYRGVPYMDSQSWAVDECTTCSCDNGTVTCVIESCQPAFCSVPVKPEGECCYLCPYNVVVKKVLPEITSRYKIAEGGDNQVSVNVSIKFHDAMDTTGVSGINLWKLSAWASAIPDGNGPRIGFNEDILDLKQKDKYFKKREKFKFTNLDFSFSDPMTDCEDMKYICVRIERGDNPRTTGDLGYTLRGYPDSNAQTGCTRAPECRRSQAQGSDSVSSGEGLLPCVYRGLPYLHSEKWAVDECTTCACDNASITCVIETCQPTLCDTPIKPEGICCNICSYKVLVMTVLPLITYRDTIVEGGNNQVSIDVSIKFHDALGTSGVSGEDLWKLSAWASATPDGNGQRIGFDEDILDPTQKDQYFSKRGKLEFTNLDFSFSECKDMKYICVRIERGDNPRTTENLNYTLGGYPDSNAQTGCTEAPECRHGRGTLFSSLLSKVLQEARGRMIMNVFISDSDC